MISTIRGGEKVSFELVLFLKLLSMSTYVFILPASIYLSIYLKQFIYIYFTEVMVIYFTQVISI